MRILVVDDNEYVRRGVVSLLQSQAGWEVCGEARNGDEALQQAREWPPDLILLDISMPGMDGLEVARLLRRPTASAKIVIMSQHDPDRLRSRAFEAGAADCLDKSLLGTQLIPRIKKLMEVPQPQGARPQD
jgi:DNA-binding NarL/FixJ family response regulator